MSSVFLRNVALAKPVTVRKPGANAEVTITPTGIERTELRQIVTSYYPSKQMKTLDDFDPSSYSIVDELLNKMSPQVRREFLKTKSFEIIATEQCLNFGNDGMDLFQQLARLAPIIGRIESLIVRVQVPVVGAIRKKADYKASSTRAFLEELAYKVGLFKSLKRMDVLLEMPKGSDLEGTLPFSNVCAFYRMRFRKWKLKLHVDGKPNLLVDDVRLAQMDAMNLEFLREEEEEVKEERKRRADEKRMNNVARAPINYTLVAPKGGMKRRGR
ncbi:uncharacterized protein LY89DRAFT_715128 [Mollisia scopiformis]|uniref:Uncharacterized protein n=1 Tax=Mollisia scopiformis TaxID=149040 RepID=A0A194XPU9_MOLSC|nr:uncharacterized protein LY89DRAFT_715128 [Mollisia scopiformis]KUJ22218.1 hypothetical protein LY89DRAFT_715128 [Mollisia scopiformis]